MNRLALLSAAALFTFGGIAIAQTPPAPDESEAVTIEVAPDAGPADEATPGMRPMRPGRPGMGPGMGQGMGRPGGPGMGMHRPGMMPPPPAELTLPETKGAVFVFEGPGRGRIVIKCADEDSTQSCAEAVKPLLDTITADRGPGRGPGMGMGRPGGPGKGPCMMGQGGPGQGQGRGPCGGGMGPGGPGAAPAPAATDAPAQAQ